MDINFSVHLASYKGLRDQNEDAEVIILNLNGSNKKIKPINFFAIFDGHGGKHISSILKKIMPKYFTKLSDYSDNTIIEECEKIQQALIKQHNKEATYEGSTCLAMINYIENNILNFVILNIGDCRCVICKDNNAIPITKDHKPYHPEEKYRIQSNGGIINYDGTDWRIGLLSVSRTFGDLDTKHISHIPEIFRFQYEKTIKFIIMACDGLWDVMTNQEAVDFILEHSYDISTKTRINPEINVSQLLAKFAFDKGSSDNVSVIVIFID